MKCGFWPCAFGCPQVAVPGKDEDRWRGKDEVALFKRWRRTASSVEAPTTIAPAPPAQPSELLKFLAIVSIPLKITIISFRKKYTDLF